jgi:hypothetical protein
MTNIDDVETVLADLHELAIVTSIWQVSDVKDEPESRLTSWRAYLVKGEPDTVHFVGYAGYEGRVCSPVKEYDKVTHRGVTRSGRVYELLGRPGYNSDAEYVWHRWLDMMGNPVYTDISEQFA